MLYDGGGVDVAAPLSNSAGLLPKPKPLCFISYCIAHFDTLISLCTFRLLRAHLKHVVVALVLNKLKLEWAYDAGGKVMRIGTQDPRRFSKALKQQYIYEWCVECGMRGC